MSSAEMLLSRALASDTARAAAQDAAGAAPTDGTAWCVVLAGAALGVLVAALIAAGLRSRLAGSR